MLYYKNNDLKVILLITVAFIVIFGSRSLLGAAFVLLGYLIPEFYRRYKKNETKKV